MQLVKFWWNWWSGSNWWWFGVDRWWPWNSSSASVPGLWCRRYFVKASGRSVVAVTFGSCFADVFCLQSY